MIKASKEIIKQNRELIALGVGLATPLIILTIVVLNQKPNEQITPPVELAEVKEFSFFENVEIEGSSALVTNLNTGEILFKKNENEKKPIASITKLMTTLVASEKLGSKNKSTITINDSFLTPEGDWGLRTGDTWSVKNLIDFTLLTSSNDGAKALALSAFESEDENKFVAEMNSLSQRLGLADTYFRNETGLDINFEQEAGAYSTATDITKVLDYISVTNPALFDGTNKRTDNFVVNDKLYKSNNTNEIINELPGAVISKTGYTELAGGNLVVVVDLGLNNPVSIVVLGSSKTGRFEDVKKLYDEAVNYYSDNILKQ